MKAKMISLLLTIIMVAGACGNRQNDTADSNIENAEVVKAPQMDLHTAVVLEDMTVIRQHVEAGSDLDIREPSVGSSPLITAAVFGKTNAARALVEGGANVNLKNNQGSTALHSAAFLCRLEIVELLLENGADRELVNAFGSTALQSVAGPFDQAKPIYDEFSKNLGPLGLKLDYEKMASDRPRVAQLLKN